MAKIILDIANTGELVPVNDIDLESVTNRELIEAALYHNVIKPPLSDIRMLGEYVLLQKLQMHPSINNNTIKITIQYKDKKSGIWKSILNNPTDYFGEPLSGDFRVTYKMPMYVKRGKLKTDWQTSLLFSVPNDIEDETSYITIEIEGGGFPDDSIPYNNHISKGWIAYAPAWGIHSRVWHYYGIWYFILALGCTLNLEKDFVVAEPEEDPLYGVHHLNYEAYVFWKNDRNMQPTSKIDWPFKLVRSPIVIQMPHVQMPLEVAEEKASMFYLLNKDDHRPIIETKSLSELGFKDGDTIKIVAKPI